MDRRTWMASLAAGAAMLTGSAWAQDWPTQPITIYVGFPPGGIADAIPRLMQDRMAAEFGQPVIVENRPGAAGALMMVAVAEGQADHTLGIATLQNLILPSVTANPPYDPRTDHRGISVLASVPNVLAVHPDVPVESVEELIAYAKEHPGDLNWGTAGNATAPHLMQELFNLEAGVDIEHVPYNGIQPAYVDLVAGRIQIMLGPFGSMRPHLESLRPLAVSTPERNRFIPELPPMHEASGIPSFTLTEWYALVAPSGMSDAVAERISAFVEEFLTGPEFASLADQRGLTVIGSEGPNDANAYLMNESERMAAVADQAGVRLD